MKHVPKKMTPQPTMKQRSRHDLQQQQHENQHPNNLLNGDQAIPSVELSTGKVDTNKLESLNWHFNTARGFPNTSEYLDHLCPQTTYPC